METRSYHSLYFCAGACLQKQSTWHGNNPDWNVKAYLKGGMNGPSCLHISAAKRNPGGKNLNIKKNIYSNHIYNFIDNCVGKDAGEIDKDS